MPSSYSASLRVELQYTGESINLWGDKLNSALSRLDSSIAGWTTIAITGDYTLTTANGSADEARSAMLKFNGTLSANSTIVCPAVSKTYFVFNNTNYALAFSIGAGTTVSVDAGDKTVVFCDGTGFHTITFGALGLKDYIASVTATAGAVPGVTGNAGKVLYTDGASAFWRQIVPGDLGSFGASAAQVWEGSSSLLAITPAARVASQAFQALSYGATVTPDLELGRNFTLSASGNFTLGNPTNCQPGDEIYIAVTHTAGGNVLAVGSAWKRGNGLGVLSTTNGYKDVIFGVVETVDGSNIASRIIYDVIRNAS